ncbi:YnjH family protein [Erwinia tasmaniensis]|uniref:DUF1496 domain-containing protein n=1 Tax=Erwinia tasmaniensis (strain DSM 17950 / CFBP 7177 / CIP 109463 / NCPPB 4357 / Et1/99) TaxID=465817 RepID=B2VKW5_ERWT9|nr:YnjH family protein [Erwinia tasmaniensis]CAO96614.1 Conserved hypothetical protein (DUF1496) [Erwinia tasmaniensis Et1/99]
MKRHLTWIFLLGISAPVLAEHYVGSGGGNTDVVVNMPPEVWSRGESNPRPPCQRCCIYDNRNYTEGAVLKSEGVLLQCVRDEDSLGTDNLIWRRVK